MDDEMLDWLGYGLRYGVGGRGYKPEPLAFVSEAKAELARLIDDVQKNRNRPEELP